MGKKNLFKKKREKQKIFFTLAEKTQKKIPGNFLKSFVMGAPLNEKLFFHFFNFYPDEKKKKTRGSLAFKG